MQAQLILVLGVCCFAYSFKTNNDFENGDASERSDPRLPETRDAGNQSSHVHVHNGVKLTASALESSQEVSTYFVSALLKKYNDSQTLSLDGFARLYCSLGLVPAFTETTNEADDISLPAGAHYEGVHGAHSLVCGEITFDEVQALFEEQAAREREHEHAEEDLHEHADEHSDHDHQPNRNVGGAKSSSAQGGHTHHHDDDVSGTPGDHDRDTEDSHHHEDKNLHFDNHDDTDSHEHLPGATHKSTSSQNHSIAENPNSSHTESSPSTDRRRRRREMGFGSYSSTASGPDSQQTIHVHHNHSTVSKVLHCALLLL